jgi:tRNA(adenine34) deaminase
MRSSPSVMHTDTFWMQRALELAALAEDVGEVPVGAVLVRDAIEIGYGCNAPIGSNDPTAHAEINALRMACAHEHNYRLPESTLFVTLEPCIMCAGAIIQARVARVVFAASEPRSGAAGSVFNVFAETRLNHRLVCEGGLLAEFAAAQLKEFFVKRRA